MAGGTIWETGETSETGEKLLVWDFEAGRLLHYVVSPSDAPGVTHEKEQRDQPEN